jgi:hypothetical protein
VLALAPWFARGQRGPGGSGHNYLHDHQSGLARLRVTDGVAINNNGQVTGRSGQVVGTDADGNTGHSQLFRPGRGLLPGCDQR